MYPFTCKVKFFKYEKYGGSGDPHDHIRDLCALSMKFLHELTYLINLFFLEVLAGMAWNGSQNSLLHLCHLIKWKKVFPTLFL